MSGGSKGGLILFKKYSLFKRWWGLSDRRGGLIKLRIYSLFMGDKDSGGREGALMKLRIHIHIYKGMEGYD